MVTSRQEALVQRSQAVSGSVSRIFPADVSITGERYTSREFMELELDRLWPRVWNIGAWAREIPVAGDFVTHAIGRESILMVRQADGSVRAFHNVCPHRGNRLVYSERGSVERFTCSYHGWQFDQAGTVVHVQDEEDFPLGNPCGKLTLAEIPCEVWAGFVWYNMDAECASLAEFLGEVKDYVDLHDLSAARRIYYKVCEVGFNWKLLHDNFCESYHLPATHPQISDYYDDDYRNTDFELYETGHNLMKMKGSLPSLRYDEPFAINETLAADMQNWGLDPAAFEGRAHAVREALQAQRRKLGPARGYRYFERLPASWLTDAYHFNLFPGTSLTVVADGAQMQRCEPHPTDPTRSIYEHWFLALKGADSDLVPGPEGMVSWEEAERRVVEYGQETLSEVADQDLERASGQQLGVQSRGFAGAYLSGQENRVQQFHNFIDRYLRDDIGS